MPSRKADREASSVASATSRRSRGGTPAGSTRSNVLFLAASTAAWALGLRRAPASSESTALENCAATTAPSAATPNSPATRAIALLIPEARPALCSSASASTVAVSGATVIVSPNENTSSAGSSSVT